MPALFPACGTSVARDKGCIGGVNDMRGISGMSCINDVCGIGSIGCMGYINDMYDIRDMGDIGDMEGAPPKRATTCCLSKDPPSLAGIVRHNIYYREKTLTKLGTL